ncbi:MAG: HEPN domain-containing protein [Armatimonadetes bacterium]|nr:HEPN domain-containing protein [Armatimonadota bacterium]MDW8028391.1 HEPN domain-containing protein [Armatimonadota bacterium]
MGVDAKEALAKAEKFLKAAKVTLATELSEVCAVACYYAVFWAAIAMLHYVGIKQPRWKHGDLKEGFGMECVRRRKLCPPEFGHWIGELYELRNSAMYDSELVPIKFAERALRCVANAETQKIKEGVASID